MEGQRRDELEQTMAAATRDGRGGWQGGSGRPRAGPPRGAPRRREPGWAPGLISPDNGHQVIFETLPSVARRKCLGKSVLGLI